MKRSGLNFFVLLEYDDLLAYYILCAIIIHDLSSCRGTREVYEGNLSKNMGMSRNRRWETDKIHNDGKVEEP